MSGALAYDQSAIDNRPPNVAVQFLDRVKTSPSREAYRYPEGDGWESHDLGSRPATRSTSSPPACSRSGIEPEQRVGIASSTRYEWILADLASCAPAARPRRSTRRRCADDVAYILADSECRVVFAEDDEQVAKLREHARPSCRTLAKVVTFDGRPPTATG